MAMAQQVNYPNELVALFEKCNKYTTDNSYVYHSFLDTKNNRWLIVMQKLEDTTTDENRSNIVNRNYAKFEANKLKVIEIIDMNNSECTLDGITDQFGIDKTINYEINNVVESDECNISYFKTLVAAYFYERKKIQNGQYFQWYINGGNEKKCTFKNGWMDGKCESWHENGRPHEKCSYKDGWVVGQQKLWDPNGRMYIN